MVVRFSGRGFRTSQPVVENIGALASNREILIASNLMPEEANNFGGIFPGHFIFLQGV